MHTHSDPAENQPIKPLAFKPGGEVEKKEQAAAKIVLTKKTAYFYSFLAMTAALVAVFFGLPKLVEKNAIQPQSTPIAGAINADSTNRTRASPYSDAEAAKQRRKVQEVLQEILNLQEDLEERKVEKWASTAHAQSRALNAEADAIYRRGRYQQALDKYQQALNILKNLRASIPSRIEDYLAAGNLALNNGDAPAANDNFDTVLDISVDHPRGTKGKERARQLPRVWENFTRAEGYFKDGDLDKSQRALTQALALDPLTEPAIALLAKVESAILERDYNNAMSDGYTALTKDNFARAQQLFLQAQKLKPKARDPAAALAQASSGLTQKRVDHLFNLAGKLEQQEQWHSAADNYRKLLAVDPSLVPAITGKARAEARAQLDDALQALLADPLSLSQRNRSRYARKVLADAQQLKADTPRVTNQIKQLQKSLDQALTPVPVYLKSDTFTEVSIFHVGNLGSFKEREIKIKPGRYTAVGTRKGYRDVRKELVITPTDAPVILSIRCEERITTGHDS